MSVYLFLVLSPNKRFRAKNNVKLLFSHFTCLAGGAGCVDAGLALSKAKKDDNDNEFDDSDGGTCPDAIGLRQCDLNVSSVRWGGPHFCFFFRRAPWFCRLMVRRVCMWVYM